MVSKRPLAVVTMVRNDHDWARKWIAHYAAQVQSKRDLYIVLHGDDPELEAIFAGCSTMTIPLLDHGIENFERRRLDFEHFFIRGLQAYFRCVLMVDIDEFVAVVPSVGKPLWAYLRDAHRGEMVRSALGFEIVHPADDESPPLDLARPVLAQRQWMFCNEQYCKPCAFYFNFGGATHHRVWGAPWVIDENLLLFHLRYADRGRLDAYIETRRAYFEEQEGSGSPASKSWRNPRRQYRLLMKEAEALPREDLTPERRAALRREILHGFAETGKIGTVASGLLRVPESYRDLA
jgi:hypothetical protein